MALFYVMNARKEKVGKIRLAFLFHNDNQSINDLTDALQARVTNDKFNNILCSGVVLETRVLVSRRLEDRNGGLGLGLGLNC